MTNDLSPTNTGAQTAHRLLRLLREGAAPEAYQALLDGCSADELPCLGPLVEDALHVRAQLEERRRREDELAALYETAGDLLHCVTLRRCSRRSCAVLADCSAPTRPT
ncbi:hypothetical protein ACFQ0G_07365 [Streptomyces chiangmaiensis]